MDGLYELLRGSEEVEDLVSKMQARYCRQISTANIKLAMQELAHMLYRVQGTHTHAHTCRSWRICFTRYKVHTHTYTHTHHLPACCLSTYPPHTPPTDQPTNQSLNHPTSHNANQPLTHPTTKPTNRN